MKKKPASYATARYLCESYSLTYYLKSIINLWLRGPHWMSIFKSQINWKFKLNSRGWSIYKSYRNGYIIYGHMVIWLYGYMVIWLLLMDIVRAGGSVPAYTFYYGYYPLYWGTRWYIQDCFILLCLPLFLLCINLLLQFSFRCIVYI